MLSQSGQNGWCLVRDSLTKPGQLTLSIWLSGQPRHIRYTRVTFPYILNSPPSVPPSLSPPSLSLLPLHLSPLSEGIRDVAHLRHHLAGFATSKTVAFAYVQNRANAKSSLPSPQ